MTERDQIAGAFGGHNTGHSRHPENIALMMIAALNQAYGLAVEQHIDLGSGLTQVAAFAGDIDHIGFTSGIDVTELSHARVSHRSLSVCFKCMTKLQGLWLASS